MILDQEKFLAYKPAVILFYKKEP